LLTESLTREGFEVVTVGTSRSPTLAKDTSLDLVLTDINMPHLSVPRLAQDVQERSDFSQCYDRSATVERRRSGAAGRVDYLCQAVSSLELESCAVQPRSVSAAA